MTSMQGIDVSAVGQGLAFNWPAYKGRVSFAFAKASEGLTFRDGAYTANQRGAAGIGARFGAYHVLHGADDGAAQAHWFLTCASPRPGDLVAIDYEPTTTDGKTAAQMSAIGGAFADVIRAELGAWPFAYSDITMVVSGYLASLGQCPLWLANPSGTRTAGGIGPWPHGPSIEQTGQRGVDTDVFYGDGAQLLALAVKHAAVAPPPPPRPPAPLEHAWLLKVDGRGIPSLTAVSSANGKTWE